MASWRQPELEAVLGGPLDADGLTQVSIERLVTESVSESEVLDFKKALWASAKGSGPTPWSPEQEFGKDVAALANSRGGLIIVGVADTKGVATSVPRFALGATPEAEERRLRQALANHVSPIPRCEFVWVEGDPDGWLLGLVIPPSPRAPHAVLGERGDSRVALHYPVRHGMDTIWLSEHEVAERYRRRLDAQATEGERLRAVVGNGVHAVTGSSATGVWLFAAVVPESPIEGRLDSAAVKRIDDWHRTSGITSPLGRSLEAFGRGIAAPERVVFTGTRYTSDQDETEIRAALVELYVDGSALAAAPIGIRTTGDHADRQVGEITLVDDGILLLDVALRWCADQAGAWGLARVVMGFIDADTTDGTLDKPIELVESDTGTVRRIRPSRQIAGEVRADAVADMAATLTVQERLAVVHQAVSRLLHWFGMAEPAQIRPDGTIVTRQFTMSYYPQVEAWAKHHEVDAELL